MHDLCLDVGPQQYLAPQRDVDELIKSFSLEFKERWNYLKCKVEPNRFKCVFLTGATGFVGRMVLNSIVNWGSGDIKVVCLSRNSTKEEAFQRIKTGLYDARIWEEKHKRQISVVLGDLSVENFGLSAKAFDGLAKGVNAVFHCASLTDLSSAYSEVRTTNTTSILSILRLCTTWRQKHLFFLSTLGQFPAFFALFGKEFKNQSICETSHVDTKELQKLFTPDEIGFPWSKWASEQVVQTAFELGLPGAIFRIPRLWMASTEFGFADIHCFATMVIAASVQEAKFPIGLSTAPLTPVNVVSDLMVSKQRLWSLRDTYGKSVLCPSLCFLLHITFQVSLAFKVKRIHRIYHLLNPLNCTR